ncbi:MAG TPA: PAS domain S-box protein, partial [Alphaproteobacteria bacterium]|nr:PAS domain S-box protein [Alphaproteobacteria bacterium]
MSEQAGKKPPPVRLGPDEARYRAIVDTAVDAIAVIDEQGTIWSFNPAAERTFGYSATEAIGQNVRLLMPAPYHGDHDRYLGNYRETGRRKIIGIGREVTGRRKDGSEFPVELSVAEWRDGDRRYFTGIMRDVSERRRAEAEIRHLAETLELRVAERTAQLEEANRRLQAEIHDRHQAEEALRQAQKMEAVGRLTGGIAHDFNNLLTAIAGNLMLLERKLTGEPKLLRLAVNASLAAARAEKLTQQLLAFSRKQALRPQPLDLNQVIFGLGDLLHQTVGEQVEIRKHLAPNLRWALADANQLEISVLNLVINARDAMAAGGQIVITTANAPAPAAAEAGGEEGFVQLTIRDDGSGMTPEVLAQAFEPFFTTKEVGKGTGLGLAQVYGFVRQSNGHIRIESQPGRGTSVHILLPAIAAPAAAEPLPAAEAQAPAGRSGTVLIAEDNGNVREFAAEVLRDLGYAIVEAHNGEEAMAILRQRDDIDLLFTDVVMPGALNGIELAKEARAHRPALKV